MKKFYVGCCIFLYSVFLMAQNPSARADLEIGRDNTVLTICGDEVQASMTITNTSEDNVPITNLTITQEYPLGLTINDIVLPNGVNFDPTLPLTVTDNQPNLSSEVTFGVIIADTQLLDVQDDELLLQWDVVGDGRFTETRIECPTFEGGDLVTTFTSDIAYDIFANTFLVDQSSSSINIDVPRLSLTAFTSVEESINGPEALVDNERFILQDVVKRTLTVRNENAAIVKELFVDIALEKEFGEVAVNDPNNGIVISGSNGSLTTLNFTVDEVNEEGLNNYSIQLNSADFQTLFGTATFEENQELTIAHTFIVTTCSTTEVGTTPENEQSMYSVTWNCGSSSTLSECYYLDANFNAEIRATPSKTLFKDGTFNTGSFCKGAINEDKREGSLSITMENDTNDIVVDAAENSNMMLDVTYRIEYRGDLVTLDATNMTFNGTTIESSAVTSFLPAPSRGILIINFQDLYPTSGPDPDGIGVGLEDLDGDGFYDDLRNKATIELANIVVNYEECPVYFEPFSNKSYSYTFIVGYRNLCGIHHVNDRPSIDGLSDNERRFSTEEGLENLLNIASFRYSNIVGSRMEIPDDVIDINEGQLSAIFESAIVFGGRDETTPPQRLGVGQVPTDLFTSLDLTGFNSEEGILKAIVKVPDNAILPAGVTSLDFTIAGQGVVTVPVSQSGPGADIVLEIDDFYPDSIDDPSLKGIFGPSTTINYNRPIPKTNFDLPLQFVDCPSSQLGNGQVPITFELSRVIDDCDCSENLTQTTARVNIFCISNIPCEGLITDTFDLKRTTLGWPEIDGNEFYTATERDAVGVVDLDTEGLALNRVLPQDEIEIRVQGSIGETVSGPTNEYTISSGGGDLKEYVLELRYNYNVGRDNSIPLFEQDNVTGVFEITNSVTGSSVFVDATEVEFIDVPNGVDDIFTNRIRFYLRGNDLSTIDANTTIELVTRLKIVDGTNNFSRSIFKTNQFEAEYFGVFGVQNEIIGSCRSRINSLEFYNNTVVNSNFGIQQAIYCKSRNIEFSIIESYNSGEIFPNEYRNLFAFTNNTIEYEFPKNAINLSSFDITLNDVYNGQRVRKNINFSLANLVPSLPGAAPTSIVSTEGDLSADFQLIDDPNEELLKFTITADWAYGEFDNISNSVNSTYILKYTIDCGYEEETLTVSNKIAYTDKSYLNEENPVPIEDVHIKTVDLATPNLNITAAGQMDQTFRTSSASWDIGITNIDQLNLNVRTQSAPYTWLHVESESASVHFEETDIQQLLATYPENNFISNAYNPTDSDGNPILNELFIEVATNFVVDSDRIVTVPGTIINCNDELTDMLKVTAGFNCDAYPNPNLLDETCGKPLTVEIPYRIIGSDLGVNFILPDNNNEVSFCDTFEYELELLGENEGLVTDLQTGFIAPEGLVLQGGTYSRGAMSGSFDLATLIDIPVTIPATFDADGQEITPAQDVIYKGFDLDALVFDAADIAAGTAGLTNLQNQDDPVFVTFTFGFDCNYDEGSNLFDINFLGKGTRSCGTVDVETSNQRFELSLPVTDIGIVSGAIEAEELVCNTNDNEVNFTLTNTGTSASNGNEVVTISGIIPNDVTVEGFTITDGENGERVITTTLGELLENPITPQNEGMFSLTFSGTATDCRELNLELAIVNNVALSCTNSGLSCDNGITIFRDVTPFTVPLASIVIEPSFTFDDTCNDITSNVLFTANTVGDMVTHEWIILDSEGNEVLNATASSSILIYKFPEAGDYTVTHIVRNTNQASCGTCELRASSAITIVENCNIASEGCELTSSSGTKVNRPDSSCFILNIENQLETARYIEVVGLKQNEDDVLDLMIESLTSEFRVIALPESTPNGAIVFGHVDGIIPTGVNNNIATICLEQFNINSQTIQVNWYDENPVEDFSEPIDPICSNEFELDFEIPLECVEIINNSVECTDDGMLIYNFQVVNNASVPLEYVVLLLEDNNVDVDIPTLAPGETSEIITTSIPNIYSTGDEVCFKVNAHDNDQKDAAGFCCQSNIDYCFTVPICCSEIITRADVDNYECSFHFHYGNGTGIAFNSIDVIVTTPGVSFSNFEINTRWDLEFVTPSHYSLTYDTFDGSDELPFLTSLPKFYLNSGDTTSQKVLINFKLDGEVICTKEVDLFCNSDCMLFDNESITCLGNDDDRGEYQYDFSFYNNSGLPIERFEFTATTPEGVEITPEIIGPENGTTFAVNEFHDISVILPEIEGEEFCFRLRAYSDGEICCLTDERCITLPDNCSTPPLITFITPVDRQVFSERAIEVEADVVDEDGSVVSVTLFLDGNLIRRQTEPPYEWGVNSLDIALSNLSPGLHRLTLEAIDDDGLVSSESIMISILGSATNNVLPSITFANLEDGATFVEGESIDVIANASDVDGSIFAVQFFINGIFIRAESVEPYNWGGDADPTLSNLPVGDHVLEIVAIDNEGAVNSTAITITVVESNNTQARAESPMLVNSPNPVIGSVTTITFVIADDENVIIELFNILGERVAIPFRGFVEGGIQQQVTTDVSGLSSGVYMIRLTTDSGKIQVHRMVVN